MTRLLTPQICTMTELREPQKVLDRAGGKPVAILKNSALVGYLVPA
jgi:antitoxin StbD